jgi:hypothetical protein
MQQNDIKINFDDLMKNICKSLKNFKKICNYKMTPNNKIHGCKETQIGMNCSGGLSNKSVFQEYQEWSLRSGK